MAITMRGIIKSWIFPIFMDFPVEPGCNQLGGKLFRGEKVILFGLVDSKPEDQPGRAEPDFPFDGIKLDD